nr:hypothetical protein [Nanoarchaeota archaeon]
MSQVKELLEKRTQSKKKKPNFIRRNVHKKKRLKSSWRRPRGLHNKQRLKKRGHVKNPSSGYRASKRVRGIHKSGLVLVTVSNLNQLNLVTKNQGIVLSSNLGDKKRKIIIEEIKKKGLPLLNLDADKTLARIESKIKERQELQKKKLEKKKEKKKGIEAKVKKEEVKKEEAKKEEAKKEEAEKKEPELTDEEKKKLEKQEKDKLLTKKT